MSNPREVKYHRIPLELFEELWQAGVSDGLNIAAGTVTGHTRLRGSEDWYRTQQNTIALVLQRHGLLNPYAPKDKDKPYADG